MWVLIDRLGLILFDATFSTALLFSLATLAILVCRQPARRLFIARVALCASLLMFPLTAICAFAPCRFGSGLDAVQIGSGCANREVADDRRCVT